MYRRSTGLTLLELLIGIIILGIIAGIAVPSMQHFMQRSQVSTVTQELISSLHFAKSEAVKLGQSVSVCPIGGSDTTCSTDPADWVNNGWRVFITNDNQQLAVKNIVNPQITIATNDPNGDEITLITFQSSGFPSEGIGTFSIQTVNCTSQNRREISISPTGQVTQETLLDCE